MRQAFTAGPHLGAGSSLGFLAQLFIELSAFIRFMFHIGFPAAGKLGPHTLGECRNPQAVTAKNRGNAKEGEPFRISREQK